MEKLVGTEKQVKWANAIRAEKLSESAIKAHWKRFDEGYRDFFAGQPAWIQAHLVEVDVVARKSTGDAIERLMTNPSAKYWINNRLFSLANLIDNEQDFPGEDMQYKVGGYLSY